MNLEGQRAQRKGVVRPDYILTIPDKTMTCRAMIMCAVAESAERYDPPDLNVRFIEGKPGQTRFCGPKITE